MNERNADAAEVAAETLGLDMLEGIVSEIRQMPSWKNLTQQQQTTHIDRIDKRIRIFVTAALGVIFKGNYPACIAELSSVSFGKNIKAKVEIPKTAAARHELADAAGQTVVIVMADPEQFLQRMKEVQASADQRDMFHDPTQPLGHMGTDTPPSDEPGGSGGLFDNGGDALGDALPEVSGAGDQVGMDPTVDDVIANLLECGLFCAPGEWPVFTDEHLRAAFVWSIAAKNFKAEGREPPEVPEFLRFAIVIPTVEVLEAPTAPSESATAETTGTAQDAEPSQAVADKPLPPAGDDDESLIANLEFRGIYVAHKIVKRWGKLQRMAAIAWLSGRAAERPDFLPLPKVPAPGLKEDGEAA